MSDNPAFLTPQEEAHLREALAKEPSEWIEQDDYGRMFVCTDQSADEAENLRTLFTIDKDLPHERAYNVMLLARMARNAVPKLLAERAAERLRTAYWYALLVEERCQRGINDALDLGHKPTEAALGAAAKARAARKVAFLALDAMGEKPDAANIPQRAGV